MSNLKATDSMAEAVKGVPYGEVLPEYAEFPISFKELSSLSMKWDSSETGEFWVRARIHASRCKGNLGFLTLRQGSETFQIVLNAKDIGADHGKSMIKWLGALPLESIIDTKVLVVKTKQPIKSCTVQHVEGQMQEAFLVSKAAEILPFMLKDANQIELKDGEEPKEGDIRVMLATRLDHRIMDLRTFVTSAIFRIQSETCHLFREFLRGKGFTEIHTPKLLGGASEGGANIFNLNYFGKAACLAQSPQLYKQMAICGDMDRVFEIGPVFRAENSNTHRHLCEFTGLDMEMAFMRDYSEVLDLIGDMFTYIFAGLEKNMPNEVEMVYNHFHSTPFRWGQKVLKFTYEEAMNMLREAGSEIPEDITEFDMGTTDEKKLGEIVREKYKTDFYMVIDFPQAIRPFYTHENPKKPGFSNSYDIYMRGEEIVSGAQRIHCPEKLKSRAAEMGINPESIEPYIDSFRYGASPHAGCGVGLERVVMLFLGLGNIRRSCMFPRDPKRLSP